MMRLCEDDHGEDQKGFIFNLFGFDSAQTKDVFLKSMQGSKMNWIFQSDKIRKNFKHFFDEKIVEKWE
jgi:hypothetical protein